MSGRGVFISGKREARLGMLMRMKGSSQIFVTTAAALVLAACGTRSAVVVQPAAGTQVAPRGTSPAPSRATGSYRVVKGDTLYSIAFRHGVDFRDLARWNGIASPYTIWPGQVLTLAQNGTSRPPEPRAQASTRPAASTATPVFRPVAPPPSTTTPTTAVAVTNPPAPAASVPSAPVASVPVAGQPNPLPSPPPVPSTSVPGSSTRSQGGITWRWPAAGSLIKGFKSGDAIPGIEIGGPAGTPVRAAADGVVVYSGNGLVGYGELVIVKHSDSFLSAYGHNRKRLVKEGQRVSAGQEIAEMGATGAARNELQFQIRHNGNPVNPLDYLPPR